MASSECKSINYYHIYLIMHGYIPFYIQSSRGHLQTYGRRQHLLSSRGHLQTYGRRQHLLRSRGHLQRYRSNHKR